MPKNKGVATIQNGQTYPAVRTSVDPNAPNPVPMSRFLFPLFCASCFLMCLACVSSVFVFSVIFCFQIHVADAAILHFLYVSVFL